MDSGLRSVESHQASAARLDRLGNRSAGCQPAHRSFAGSNAARVKECATPGSREAARSGIAGRRECHILVGMNRRALLKSAVSAAGLSAAGRQVAHAAVPKMKITRVRVYSPERGNPLFNQSDLVVTIETDANFLRAQR